MGLDGMKNFEGPKRFNVSNVGEVKPLTGDEGCVVRSVGPQVLRGLGGRLRQALRASAVAYTGRQKKSTKEFYREEADP